MITLAAVPQQNNAPQPLTWQPVLTWLAAMACVTLLYFYFYPLRPVVLAGWTRQPWYLPNDVAVTFGPSSADYYNWAPLLRVAYGELLQFTPPAALLLGGAVLSAVINFLVVAHWLRAYFRPVLALCGAVLFTSYGWCSLEYIEAGHWAFTAWICFCACLLPRKRPVGIAAALVLCALISPGVLVFQLAVLVLWLLGEWVTDRARPGLVRATLNLPATLNWRGWVWIAAGGLFSGAIALSWWYSLDQFHHNSKIFTQPEPWSAAFKEWGAAAGAGLGMHESNVLAAVPLIGGAALGLLRYAELGKLTWLQLATVTVGFLPFVVLAHGGSETFPFLQLELIWRFAAPLTLMLIVGSASRWYPYKYMDVAAGALLLVWAYAYLSLA